MSWRELEPRASRLWLRYAPKRWPAGDVAWFDLVERRIVWPGEAREPILDVARSGSTSPDVVLLPPSNEDRAGERHLLAEALATRGDRLLTVRTSRESEAMPVPEPPEAIPVLDLLNALLARAVPGGETIPAGAIALLPLIPGFSDSGERWRPWLSSLSARSPLAVVGLVPELSPLDRRRLVELAGEDRFEEIHHRELRPVQLERAFAREVSNAKLSPFLERPEVELAPRAARNRRIAAALFEAGERWLVLGRGEADGVALLAAARYVESAPQDLSALAREGQLAHLPFLSAIARREIAAIAETGRSPLVAELRVEWIAPESAA